jgi:Leucine-rich repeat (LRR) protein
VCRFGLTRKKLITVPLFEGEELLEVLDLSQNLIQKIENLVSLPKLESLNISYNKVTVSDISCADYPHGQHEHLAKLTSPQPLPQLHINDGRDGLFEESRDIGLAMQPHRQNLRIITIGETAKSEPEPKPDRGVGWPGDGLGLEGSECGQEQRLCAV